MNDVQTDTCFASKINGLGSGIHLCQKGMREGVIGWRHTPLLSELAGRIENNLVVLRMNALHQAGPGNGSKDVQHSTGVRCEDPFKLIRPFMVRIKKCLEGHCPSSGHCRYLFKIRLSGSTIETKIHNRFGLCVVHFETEVLG